MTEQATLTPEQAILALAEAKCLKCAGSKDAIIQNMELPCPACPDIDGKPTGFRFPTLRARCRSTSHTVADEVRPLPVGKVLHGSFEVDCEACQGRGWSPVSPDDWKTITEALEAEGFTCNRTNGQWYIHAKGGGCSPQGLDDVLAVAADRAITAEST